MLAPPPVLGFQNGGVEKVLDVRPGGSETSHASEMVGKPHTPPGMWFPYLQKLGGWVRINLECSFRSKLIFCYLLLCLPLCLLFLFQLTHLSTCISHLHPHHFGPSHHHLSQGSLQWPPALRGLPVSAHIPTQCIIHTEAKVTLYSSQLLSSHHPSHYRAYSLQSSSYCLKWSLFPH